MKSLNQFIDLFFYTNQAEPGEKEKARGFHTVASCILLVNKVAVVFIHRNTRLSWLYLPSDSFPTDSPIQAEPAEALGPETDPTEM